MSQTIWLQVMGLLAVELIGVFALYGRGRWVVGTLLLVTLLITVVVAVVYDRRRCVEIGEDREGAPSHHRCPRHVDANVVGANMEGG